MITKVLSLAIVAAPALAQRISIGLDAGVRATADVTGAAAPESKRWTGGPMLEAGMARGFSLTAGLLYQRFGYRTAGSDLSGSFTASARAKVWEIPLLVERRLGKSGRGRPLVFAGYAVRWMRGREHVEGVFVGPSGIVMRNSDTAWNPDVAHGLVFGGGLEFRAGALRIVPRIQYLRWNGGIPLAGSRGSLSETAVNQVRALVGIRYR